MNRQRGFSLLVVPMSLIIATVAIPSLLGSRRQDAELKLRSRQAAQEASAIARLRTIMTAQATYRSSNADNYGSIPELIAAGLLDSRFAAAGGISGYSFTVTASGSNYTAYAYPTSTNSGRFGYYALPDALIRYAQATTNNCMPCFPPGMAGRPVGGSVR